MDTIHWFGSNHSRYRPRPDSSVDRDYNRKASRVHVRYTRAVEVLEGALKRLDAGGGAAEEAG